MTQDDILDAKIGSTQVEAIYLGSELVWPTQPVEYTYEIDSARLVISDQAAYLRATGMNYAWAMGRVLILADGVVVDVMNDVRLDVHLDSSSANLPYFYVSDNEVHAYYLGASPSSARTIGVNVTYGNSAPFAVAYGITQEANIQSVYDTYYETIFDDPVEVTERYDYDAVLYTQQYNTAASPAPAWGGSVTLICFGEHKERTDTHTAWVILETEEYVYTSGAHSMGSPTEYDSDVDIAYGTPTTIDDTDAVVASITDNGTVGFTRNGTMVVIDSEGTDYPDGRSITYTATNGDDTDTAVIYQGRNRIDDVAYEYHLAIEFDVQGDISWLESLVDVNYQSQRTPTYIYTSRAEVVGSIEDVTSQVSGVGCEPEVSEVSGIGTLVVTVPQNTMSLAQAVSVELWHDAENYATDTAEQEAAPSYPTAEVYPTIANNGAPMLRFNLLSGSISYPVTIGTVVYHYILTGTSTQVDITVRRDVSVSASGVDTAIVGPMNFINGETGEHWFTAESVSQVGIANTTFPRKNFVAPSDIQPD